MHNSVFFSEEEDDSWFSWLGFSFRDVAHAINSGSLQLKLYSNSNFTREINKGGLNIVLLVH